MQYKVSNAAIGKRKVQFACKCGEVITTPLESAGQAADCPTCRQGLVIPGVAELDAQKSQIAAMALQKLSQPSPAPPAASIPATMPYTSATPDTHATPEYHGLTVASSVLGVYAMLLYALGALALVVAFIAFVVIFLGASQIRSVAVTIGVGAIGPGIASLLAAAMAHGASAALTALRDIAINSFR